MRTSPRQKTGVIIRGAVAVGLVLCLRCAVQAQPASGDPVDAFLEALDRDLDNLPSESDRPRKPIRDAILEHRLKTLTALAKKLTTPAEISRALRVREPERFRKPTRNDFGLWVPKTGPDYEVFTDLLNRLSDEMKKAVAGTNRTSQEAFAIVAGDLVTNIIGAPREQRAIYRNAVFKQFLPQLDTLSRVDDAAVQSAVARAVANIVLELREGLADATTTAAYESIVGIIARIQKAPSPRSRRAAIEAAGAIIRPLNPDAGEESLNPRGDPPTRLDLLRVLDLAPILFDGFKDTDAEARSRAVNTFHRLASLLVKDFNSLIVTPPLPAPALDRPLTKAERDIIDKNQEDLLAELNKHIRPRLEKLREQPEVFGRVLRDRDPVIRRQAMRSLEDLALLQGFIRDRVEIVPKKDAPKPESAPGNYIEPLFQATAADVVRALRDPDVKVRLGAAQLLEDRRDRARPQAPALVQSLRDRSPFVRWTATRALSQLGGEPIPGAVAGITQLLVDYDLSVRIASANALELMGKEASQSEGMLLRVIHHGDPEFRDAAIRAVAAVSRNGAVVVPEVAKELTNPDAKVRRAAARAIGRFGKEAARAKDALKVAAEDEDPDVRRYAAEALLAAQGS